MENDEPEPVRKVHKTSGLHWYHAPLLCPAEFGDSGKAQKIKVVFSTQVLIHLRKMKTIKKPKIVFVKKTQNSLSRKI